MSSSATKIKFISAFLKDHPESASPILLKSSSSEISELIENLPLNVVSESLSTLPLAILNEVFQKKNNEFLSRLVAFVSPSLVANIFRQWSGDDLKKRIKPILSSADEKISTPIYSLLDYPSGSVGSLMNPIPFSVLPNREVHEILSFLEKQKNRYSRYIYVVDSSNSLLGVFPFKDLYYSDPHAMVSSLMNASVFSLKPRVHAKDAYISKMWKQWDAIPVSSPKNELLGVIRYHDLERYVSNHQDLDLESNKELQKASEAVGEIFKIGINATASALSANTKKTTND